MALITLIIADLPDGSVDVRMHAEPRIAPGQGEFTPGQKVAAAALNAMDAAVQQALQESQAPKLVLPASASGKKLQLVSAD